MRCHFCDYDQIKDLEEPGAGRKPYSYICIRCGHVCLYRDDADLIEARRYTDNEKIILSSHFRTTYELNMRRTERKPLRIVDLNTVIQSHRPLDPLEKLDNALQIIEHDSQYVGNRLKINPGNDFPYYHCSNGKELFSILDLLLRDGFISAPDPVNAHNDLFLLTKGYERLREIKRQRKDSRLCFVAMWFADEMNDVYAKAVKPAIEYIEEGEKESRFKAVRIDNVEHTNDINDEIIATIRRSRFMVCDLTGYRGGVYYEAGFAFGLGMEVIYTCREDWVKASKQIFHDKDGKEVGIIKEGVHFDLEHRPHIRWSPDKLDEFREKLTNRIKAVII